MPPPQEESNEVLEAPSSTYVAPLLGAHTRVKSWDLHEGADAGQTDSWVWPQVGVRVGQRLFHYFSIDAEVTYMTYLGAEAARNHALSYRLGALAELFPEEELSPFLTGGYGVYHNISGSHGTDFDMRSDYGIGARYGFEATRWRVRLDARHVITDGVGEFELGHNIEVLASAEWTFAYDDPDHDDDDNDGLKDSEDSCPMDPGPKDLRGCPDSDGDGIVDRDDQCVDEPGSESALGCPDGTEQLEEVPPPPLEPVTPEPKPPEPELKQNDGPLVEPKPVEEPERVSVDGVSRHSALWLPMSSKMTAHGW